MHPIADTRHIKLENQTPDGETLQAVFLPEKGMNLISFKKGDTEVIAQSTWPLFEERYAGLGSLIGPHFHRRRPESLPKISDENLFPHIARVRAKGIQDPFSHGIARYAPWRAEATPTQLKGWLSGKDTWNGVSLSVLEGQNFNMQFSATLEPNGLFLNLAIVSDTDSLVGIHYYYDLPSGKGKVISQVQNKVFDQGEYKQIPPTWSFDSQHRLIFDLHHAVDVTFRPYPNLLEGLIILETDSYALRTHYTCPSAENCWQLYHPADSTFVCIEPMSSQDPRHPNLTVSSLNIQLEIISSESHS